MSTNEPRLPLSRLPLNPSTQPDERNAPRAEERFTEAQMDEIKSAFSLRFASLFPGLNNTEIARRLRTTDTVVKNYIEGKRLPTPELLIQIHYATGANIQWLLTGIGQKRVETVELFNEAEESQIQEMAQKHGRNFTGEVRALTLAMVAAQSRLDGK